ncbi:MAG: hypothetical protein A2054_00815 [Deltaproteobacteria bacterium GWA2_55_10]|nr:MAG: hypothetical protein A2054_00815 [Deltaproteobacteria bacterium GWA2_55_10]
MTILKSKAACTDFLAVRIKGERIILSPISSEHARDIFCEFTEEITRYMMPKPLGSMSDACEFIEKSRKNMEAGTELVFAIVRIDSGKFLGVCALHGNEDHQTPELGVWVRKSEHGNGFGMESVRCLAEWTRENLVFSYMTYPVDRDNIPSRKIAESLGGVVLEKRVRKSASGTTLNEIVYRIKLKR